MSSAPALLLIMGWLSIAATNPRNADDDDVSNVGDGQAVSSSDANGRAGKSAEVPADVRIVMFAKGSEAFSRAAGKFVEAPLAAEVDIMPGPAYRRVAAQVRVRKPFSIAAAQRLAQPAHLTHAVVLTEVRNHKRGNKRHFVEVVVVRLRPKTTVLLAQRFFMPERKLTPTLAAVIRQRVALALAQPPPASGTGETRLAPTAPANTSDIPPGQTEVAEAANPPSAPRAPGEGHLWGVFGPAVVKRTAKLSAQASNPPCYCNSGNLLADVFPALHAAAALFWAPTGTSVGLVADGTVILANTTVSVDGAPFNPGLSSADAALHSRVITSIAVTYSAGAALRWDTGVGLEVTPMVGYHAYQFPLSDGAFPGLAYNGPWAALRLRYTFGDSMWSMHVQGDTMPFLYSHDEAARLGQMRRGLGFRLGAGVDVVLPWLEISLLVRFDDYALAFSGETFLYTPNRYSNVTLDDRMGQFVLMVGNHVW